MSTPVIIDAIVRIESYGLTLVVLLLGAVCVVLVAALPVVARANRLIGAATAAPTLRKELARMTGKWLVEREKAKHAESREADMAEKWHQLSAWASHGPELAAQPTDRQMHVVQMRRR